MSISYFMKKIVILGSTGSIGTSTLSVITHNPDKYQVFALVGGRNVELMFQQCLTFQPSFAALDDDVAAKNVGGEN
ncbi:1-deoxy-D-xylulose 5-phosphate reductoisomerase [Pasteurella multocida subsp. multocida str. Anand1_buffalo]|nr:1-deoxy-D-xylulose 5-phosphate reductoisomerase [Pasteurella multocida subsp. multocida str. Anand1_buffalo]